MIVSNCPRCGEAFRVPADELPDNAYAECPWCRETFPAADVAKALPPILQLLSADGEPLQPARNQAATIGVAGDRDSSPDVTPGTADDAGLFLDQSAGPNDLGVKSIGIENPSDAKTVVEEVNADSFNFDDAETAAEDPDSTWVGDQPSLSRDDFAPMSVSPGPPRRNKGGSGIMTMIKVVLGGVLAVPLALGILMVMGRTPDLGFWPFNGPGEATRRTAAAPPVDLSGRRDSAPPAGRMLTPNLENDALSVAPSDLAREQLIGEPQSDDFALSQDSDPATSDPPTIQSPVADSPTPDAAIVLPETAGLGIEEPKVTDSTAEDSIASAAPPDNAPSIEMPALVDGETDVPSETPAEDTLASDQPGAETRSAPADESPIADDSPELVLKTERAGKMVDAVSAYDGDAKERDRRMLMTYEEIAGACDLATNNSKVLNTLASKIKSSPLLEELGGAGASWLVYKSRKSEGIFLIGNIVADGERKTIQLDSGQVVSLVGDIPSQGEERVLAMGRIIDEDSIELLLAQPLP